MILENEATEIASLLLAELNPLIKNKDRTVAEVATVHRLDSASDTGVIADKIMKVLYPDRKNECLVSVDYNADVPLIKAIVILEKNRTIAIQLFTF